LGGLRITDLDAKVAACGCIGKAIRNASSPSAKTLAIGEKYLRSPAEAARKVTGNPALVCESPRRPLSRFGVWKILSPKAACRFLRMALTPHMLRQQFANAFA